MRVLWFADKQLPAVTRVAHGGGGWVEGLHAALERSASDLEIGIVSPGPVAHEPLRVGMTTYFHVAASTPRGGLGTAAAKWRHDPAPDSAVAQLVEYAEAFAPDVLHVFGAEHYFGLAIPLVRAPAVISLQGVATVLQRYTLSSLGPSEVARELATKDFLRGDGPIHYHWRMKARAEQERRILTSCDDYMGRTEWDARVLRLLRPSARYYVVGEVLGEPFYGPEWSRDAADAEVLFCTAGGSAIKGVETLLEALILLRRSGLRRPVLRLAGNVAGGSLGRKIRSLLGARELAGAVVLLGRQTPAEIAAELTRASAFVLPSHMENSPNSLCEAMLVGTPCIAAYVGGVPSLVKDREEGLLYHDTDPFALAGAIELLLGDPALAERLGARARATASIRHDPERIAHAALDTYREVAGRPARSAAGTPGRATKETWL